MIRVINGQVTLVLANRQLVFGIVLLMLLMWMWMFAVVAFLVSQVAFPSAVAAVEEYKEPVIVVDSPLLSDRSREARLAPAAAVDAEFDSRERPLPAFAPVGDF